MVPTLVSEVNLFVFAPPNDFAQDVLQGSKELESTERAVNDD